MPYHAPEMSTLERSRYEAKIEKRPDGCWFWMSARAGSHPDRDEKYGQLTLRRVIHKAHRLAYALHHGPIPDGLLVCHECDRPPCVNPAHLFLGTVADNTRDAMKKGRLATGERNGANTKRENMARGDRHWARRQPERLTRGTAHHSSRLTEEDVIEIRASTETPAALARRFSISRPSVDKILQRRSWKHI